MPTTSTQPEVESFETGGFKVSIVWDSDPRSPRNDSTVGTIATKRDEWSDEDAVSAEEKEAFYCNLCREAGISIDKRDGDKSEWCYDEAHSHFIILPVYAHKHSGLIMRTTPFDDSWDSGQAGFIYVSREKAEELSPEGEDHEKWAENVLSQEIETFGQYLDGEVYGYIVEDKDGETVDSCYGFYDLEYCRERARSAARDI